jgi:hypothetical protein
LEKVTAACTQLQICFYILLLLAPILLLSIFIQLVTDASAASSLSSPSFSRQEIIESNPSYWRVANEKQCPLTQNTLKQNSLHIPTIEAVSYFSDGQNLSSLIVLPQEIPSLAHSYSRLALFNVAIVDLSSKNITLDKFSNEIVSNLKQQQPPQQNSSSGYNIKPTGLGGSSAYSVEYSYHGDAKSHDSNEYKILLQWTVRDGKGYIVYYIGDPITYSNNFPIAQKMMKSLQIDVDSSNNNTSKQIENNFLRFEGLSSSHNISIQYPVDWQKREYDTTYNNNLVNVVSFVYPFSQPFYHKLSYSMIVQPSTIYDPLNKIANGNYEIKSSLADNQTSMSSNTVEEKFSDGFERVLYIKDNNNNSSSFLGKRTISLSLNLRSVTLPDHYLVSFAGNETFYINKTPCIMVDHTNWYMIPPPQYLMSTSPSSINLRPGEERDIELQLRSTNLIPSIVNLSVKPLRQIQNLNKPTLTLNESAGVSTVAVPPQGTATSILHIKAQNNDESVLPIAYPVSINAKITQKTPFTYFRNVTINGNSLTGNITKNYDNFTVTLLHPLTISERFSNFWSAWGGFIGFIGAGFTAGLAARLVGRRK